MNWDTQYRSRYGPIVYQGVPLKGVGVSGEGADAGEGRGVRRGRVEDGGRRGGACDTVDGCQIRAF